MVGIDAFTPIINTPESGILGVGRILERAVLGEDDKVCRGKSIVFSLTVDHRIVDGYVGALFLQGLDEAINDPERFWLQ